MNVRLPKNGAGNMQDMLKQAQKLQEDMANLEKELEGREYEVSAGGGAVTVKINGQKQILALDIAPEIVDPDDIETLTDLLVDFHIYISHMHTSSNIVYRLLYRV